MLAVNEKLVHFKDWKFHDRKKTTTGTCLFLEEILKTVFRHLRLICEYRHELM